MSINLKNIALEHPFLTALALSLGAAISLGVARFSYGLLLPPMRADLGWNYWLAGSMNTANAVGYLLGALATPFLMRRFGAYIALVAGAILTGVFMLLSGLVIDTGLLLFQRVLAGIASAFVFIAGGLLASRLASLHPQRAGLLIGLYYGGTGFGIILSALLVPTTLTLATQINMAHSWQAAWLALGALCLLATVAMALPARSIDGTLPARSAHSHFPLRPFAFGLGGYFMFGVGYIGYMTFVIALLRQQGMPSVAITVFYTVLGVAVIASSRIWAGMLDRFKGGQSIAVLNTLLGIATLIPALTVAPLLVFASGLLFGAVFISVVTSTTALVRHNRPPEGWSAGISAFTTVFAFGQIVGPTMVGWVADGAGGLERGLAVSACALFLGAALASRQGAVVSTATSA
ncbi:MAG: YbfB/YjiJ family MFS transporter [Pseudomonadota bacterium]